MKTTNYQNNEEAALEIAKFAMHVDFVRDRDWKIIVLALSIKELTKAASTLLAALKMEMRLPMDVDLPEEITKRFVLATTGEEMEGVVANGLWLVQCLPEMKDFRIRNAITRVRAFGERVIISSMRTTRACLMWNVCEKTLQGTEVAPIIALRATVLDLESFPRKELRYFVAQFDKPTDVDGLRARIRERAELIRRQAVQAAFVVEYERADAFTMDFARELESKQL